MTLPKKPRLAATQDEILRVAQMIDAAEKSFSEKVMRLYEAEKVGDRALVAKIRQELSDTADLTRLERDLDDAITAHAAAVAEQDIQP
jgi:hypothetical protein